MRLRGYILRLTRLFGILNRVYRVNKHLEDMLPKEKRAEIINKSPREGVKSAVNKSSLRNVHKSINNIYNNGLNKRVSYKTEGSFGGYGTGVLTPANYLKNRVNTEADFKNDYSCAFTEHKDYKGNTKIKNVNRILDIKGFSLANAVNNQRCELVVKQEGLKPLSLKNVRNPTVTLNISEAGRRAVRDNSIKKLSLTKKLYRAYDLNKINLSEIKSTACGRAEKAVNPLKVTEKSKDFLKVTGRQREFFKATEKPRVFLKGAEKQRAFLRATEKTKDFLKGVSFLKRTTENTGLKPLLGADINLPLRGINPDNFLRKGELSSEYNKQDNKNKGFLSEKNAFNEKKNNVYLNVKVDFNAYTGSLSTREEMESFANVFVKRLERELNTFAEGVHL